MLGFLFMFGWFFLFCFVFLVFIFFFNRVIGKQVELQCCTNSLVRWLILPGGLSALAIFKIAL